MKLRKYQQDLSGKIKEKFREGSKSVCAVLGCGGGKSHIIAKLMKEAASRGSFVLFLVHRRELIDQMQDVLKAWDVPESSYKLYMIQTVVRRLETMQQPRLIVIDEVHHVLSRSYIKVLKFFSGAYLVGFTATPMRMNEGGLGKVFNSLVEGVTTRWLIDNKYLADYRLFSYKLVDITNIAIKRGDYDNKEINNLMETSYIYGDTVSNYTKIASGKKAIVYCSSIKASKETVKAFRSNGYSAEHIDGETPLKRREDIIKSFKSNKVKVLCNVDILGEGFDVPDCECVILLRPTRSLTLYIQQAMRAMRYAPGKIAYIIDHVGNVYLHGFPDESRNWSLDSKRRKAKSEVLLRECPICFCCMPRNVRVCFECGYEIITKSQAQKETVEAELKEINRLEVIAKKSYQEYKNLKTFEEIDRFRRAKKYKFMWGIHKCFELGIDIPDKYQYLIRRFCHG